jgi:hypothetical protein
MTILWVMPWATFLPASISLFFTKVKSATSPALSNSEAPTSLFLWTAMVVGFFTLSARQEYSTLPALPALALLAGGALAYADSEAQPPSSICRSTLRWSGYFLLPLATLIAIVCGYFVITAPSPGGTNLKSLLSTNPDLYTLSLGHLYDLTGAAMGLFRGPLTAVALAMIIIGPVALILRARAHSYAANLTLAAGMIIALLAAHEGYVRFNPILGSKDLALAIVNQQPATDNQQPPLIILDGELTSGSTLVFYTRQQVHLINGRVNGLWYGSFWPDAPAIFETDATLHTLWAGPRRIFLFTYNPTARTQDLTPFGEVRALASAGGKTILTNH